VNYSLLVELHILMCVRFSVSTVEMIIDDDDDDDNDDDDNEGHGE